MKYLLIRHARNIPGVLALIGDSTTDMTPEGEWDIKGLVKLPQIPYDGKKAFHSPDGFNIGYNGSGPTDLAIAICHFFGKPKVYLALREQVIARLDRGKDLDIPFDSMKLVLSKLERGESL